MTQKASIPPVIFIIVGLALLGFGGWYVLRPQPSASPPPATGTRPTVGGELGSVALQSARGIDYSQLRDYLAAQRWEKADRETYEQLLHVAGPKSLARGFTPQSEMDTLPCADVKTIDRLWSVASNGRFGFSAQEALMAASGNDWRKMYREAGWLEGNTWKLSFKYDVGSRRYVYEKKPDFKNLKGGQLPTTERGYNFSVALDPALIRCGMGL